MVDVCASKAVQKYLQRHAEREIDSSAKLFEAGVNRYEYCLCLPVYAEGVALLDQLDKLALNNTSILFIIVVNQPDSKSPPDTDNLLFEQAVKIRYSEHATNDHLALYRLANGCELLMIDRFRAGRQIPAEQGVGLARKIAADIALLLISQDIIRQPWLFSTDADVTLPESYFSAIASQTGHTMTAVAVYLFPFTHIAKQKSPDDCILHATKLYERKLQAYVDGLRRAGSPYAYHTLGSTLCVSADHYAQVRGFPKRAAGEDFYILNKLRKTGSVVSLKQPCIQIDARHSARTPFGTGSSVSDIIDYNSPAPAIFYHPELFNRLAIVLNWLKQLARDCLETHTNNAADAQWKQHLARYTRSCNNDNHVAQLIMQTLQSLDFDKAFLHCTKQAKTVSQFDKHLLHWFDAFRTLKWLHTMREYDTRLSSLNEEAYNKLMFNKRF